MPFVHPGRGLRRLCGGLCYVFDRPAIHVANPRRIIGARKGQGETVNDIHSKDANSATCGAVIHDFPLFHHLRRFFGRKAFASINPCLSGLDTQPYILCLLVKLINDALGALVSVWRKPHFLIRTPRLTKNLLNGLNGLCR
jgi:hypothetical protein